MKGIITVNGNNNISLSHILYKDRLVVYVEANNITGRLSIIYLFLQYLYQWMHPKCKKAQFHFLLNREETEKLK